MIMMSDEPFDVSHVEVNTAFKSGTEKEEKTISPCKRIKIQ
jgi:hypothetical protein